MVLLISLNCTVDYSDEHIANDINTIDLILIVVVFRYILLFHVWNYIQIYSEHDRLFCWILSIYLFFYIGLWYSGLECTGQSLVICQKD